MIAEIETEYIALARAVIINAARDASKGDRSAAAWLASDETADIWFFVAGVRRDYVLAWLEKGCKKITRLKKPTRTATPAKRKKIVNTRAMQTA
jgi:hypothetical protein